MQATPSKPRSTGNGSGKFGKFELKAGLRGLGWATAGAAAALLLGQFQQGESFSDINIVDVLYGTAMGALAFVVAWIADNRGRAE